MEAPEVGFDMAASLAAAAILNLLGGEFSDNWPNMIRV
jgi:hypothetical protein